MSIDICDHRKKRKLQEGWIHQDTAQSRQKSHYPRELIKSVRTCNPADPMHQSLLDNLFTTDQHREHSFMMKPSSEQFALSNSHSYSLPTPTLAAISRLTISTSHHRCSKSCLLLSQYFNIKALECSMIDRFLPFSNSSVMRQFMYCFSKMYHRLCEKNQEQPFR